MTKNEVEAVLSALLMGGMEHTHSPVTGERYLTCRHCIERGVRPEDRVVLRMTSLEYAGLLTHKATCPIAIMLRQLDACDD